MKATVFDGILNMSHEWRTFAELVLSVVCRVANVDVKRVEDLRLFVLIIVHIRPKVSKHKNCMLEVRVLMIKSEHENIVTIGLLLHLCLICGVARVGIAARYPKVTSRVDLI